MGTGDKGAKMPQTERERLKQKMAKKESQEFLSTFQVARLLGVSYWSLLGWRKEGSGPPFLRITCGCIRYPRPALITWLNSLPRN